MRNRVITETGLADLVVEAVRTRLPASWKLSVRTRPEGKRGAALPDAILEVRAPDGRRATLVAEFRTRLEAKDVPRILAQLDGYNPDSAPIVAAPFLGRRTREVLEDMGAGYIDATGNVRLTLDDPAVFIESSGAPTNPWREDRPLRSLKGPAAGRVVRALCDFVPPYGIRELAEQSSTPVATVARVVDLLDREALLQREPRGPVTSVDWAGVLRRWTADYTFGASNRTSAFLEPRGLSALTGALRTARLRYSITSSLATVQMKAVAPPRLATIFVQSIPEASKRLELRATEAGANVILSEPFDAVVFDRTWSREDLTFAALSQVAADLLTGPGRAPTEGEELLDWMADNEDAWRTRP